MGRKWLVTPRSPNPLECHQATTSVTLEKYFSSPQGSLCEMRQNDFCLSCYLGKDFIFLGAVTFL